MFFIIQFGDLYSLPYIYQVRGTDEQFQDGAVMEDLTNFSTSISTRLENILSDFLDGVSGSVFSFQQLSTGAVIGDRNGRRELIPNQDLGSILHQLDEMDNSDHSTVRNDLEDPVELDEDLPARSHSVEE